MDWFLLSILAALSFTFFSLFSKVFLKEEADPIAYAFWSCFFCGCFTLVFTIFDKNYIYFSWGYLGLFILAAIFYAVVNVLLTIGRQLEEASTASIARQTSTIWSVIAGIIVLGEEVSIIKFLGVLLILLGNFLAIWEGKRVQLKKGFLIMLLGSLLAGLGAVWDKIFLINFISPALYGGLVVLGSSIFILIYLKGSIKRLKDEIKFQGWKLPLIGLLFASNLFLVIKSAQIGEISKVQPIFNSSLVLTVILGIIFLKEKDNLVRKLIGAVIAFVGVYLLS